MRGFSLTLGVLLISQALAVSLSDAVLSPVTTPFLASVSTSVATSPVPVTTDVRGSDVLTDVRGSGSGSDVLPSPASAAPQIAGAEDAGLAADVHAAPPQWVHVQPMAFPEVAGVQQRQQQGQQPLFHLPNAVAEGRGALGRGGDPLADPQSSPPAVMKAPAPVPLPVDGEEGTGDEGASEAAGADASQAQGSTTAPAATEGLDQGAGTDVVTPAQTDDDDAKKDAHVKVIGRDGTIVRHLTKADCAKMDHKDFIYQQNDSWFFLNCGDIALKPRFRFRIDKTAYPNGKIPDDLLEKTHLYIKERCVKPQGSWELLWPQQAKGMTPVLDTDVAWRTCV